MLKDGIGFDRVIVCCGRVDLRYGIDGLSSYVRLHYSLNPIEKGALFLFCGTRADRIKGIIYEGDGTTLITKRLSKGNRFQWPRTPDEAKELSKEQYRLLMNGFAIEGTIREFHAEKHEKAPGTDTGILEKSS